MDNSVRNIGSRRATLAVEVRSEIERMIVDGELAAGEKLNELGLATTMGVSRGTVREAIRSLVDTGLIDLFANRGAFVHEVTLQEVRNLYDLRRAIFAMACSAAARRVREGEEPTLVERLEDNLAQMRRVEGETDPAVYYELNIAFHDMLMEGAGNPKAKTIYDNLVREMHLFRRRGLSIASNIAKSVEEHTAITEAVAAGDPEAARKAADNHITSGMARYITMTEGDGPAAG
ncbi:GntR family transcriptional regulator [Roseivivax marinus]|jgi:DNA-binding GntR family transcriptional regulator|uniref:GntR family transcriptional regulator n=1 Tax=Roseivivax marinus TaxID=1379903 RepID=W4HHN7_9RHOB|nr:GntR family transcriptional regulator [Roseivivax marinus]ETW11500.1 GntR family transcriptional regulator [Roseivivax marinus]